MSELQEAKKKLFMKLKMFSIEGETQPQEWSANQGELQLPRPMKGTPSAWDDMDKDSEEVERARRIFSECEQELYKLRCPSLRTARTFKAIKPSEDPFFDVEDDLSSDSENVSGECTALDAKIIRQVEFYFGDFNLPKDKFMLEVIAKDEGWISMDILMTFKRLAAITSNPRQVLKSLSKSQTGLLEVDMRNSRIRRHPWKPPPLLDSSRRLSLQDRTVFVAGFDRNSTTMDDLIEFFEGEFKDIGNIRMRWDRPKRQQPDESEGEESNKPLGVFLGSVFVTFKTKEAGEHFISQCKRGSGVIYKDKRLFAKWQTDHLRGKTQNNDEFKPEIIDRTVYVQGFDCLDTPEEVLADFFCMFPGAETVRKRCYRIRSGNCEPKEEEDFDDWHFTGSVFVTFEDKEDAQRFLDLQDLNFKGDVLKKCWQAEFYGKKGKFAKQLKQLLD